MLLRSSVVACVLMAATSGCGGAGRDNAAPRERNAQPSSDWFERRSRASPGEIRTYARTSWSGPRTRLVFFGGPAGVSSCPEFVRFIARNGPSVLLERARTARISVSLHGDSAVAAVPGSGRHERRSRQLDVAGRWKISDIKFPPAVMRALIRLYGG